MSTARSAERLNVGFGAEIMGRGKFGPQTGPWTDLGTEDEWRDHEIPVSCREGQAHRLALARAVAIDVGFC